MELTDAQVEFIRADLHQRGITISSLRDGLLDHLCCMLEAEETTADFEIVYRKVIREFGEHQFLLLQEETNQLIQTYQKKKMNKALRITGFLSSALIIIGSLFKFMHWPGANIMLLLGTFIVAVLFAPVFFIYRYKTGEDTNRNTVLAIIGASGSILLGLGGSFKFMHWPGAFQLLYAGMAILLLGYIPVYMVSVYRKSLNLTNAISTVVIMIAISGIIFTTLGTGNSQQTNHEYAELISKEEALTAQQQRQNEHLFSTLTDSVRQKINGKHQEAIAYINYISQFKALFLKSTEVNNYTEVTFWNSTGMAESINPNNTTYSFTEVLRKREALYHLSATGTINAITSDQLHRMPFGLLMLQLSQWQREAVQLDAQLLNSVY